MYEVLIGVGGVIVPVVLWGLDRWRPPKSKHGKRPEPATEPPDGGSTSTTG